MDLYKRQALPELLEILSDIKGIDWIRLHYAYPAAFPREVIRVMKEGTTSAITWIFPFSMQVIKSCDDAQKSYTEAEL